MWNGLEFAQQGVSRGGAETRRSKRKSESDEEGALSRIAKRVGEKDFTVEQRRMKHPRSAW
jgi:hypothetical protein